MDPMMQPADTANSFLHDTTFDQADPAGSAISRDKPEPTESRGALVKRLLSQISSAKRHHEKAFKRMRADMDFAFKHGCGEQWPEQREDDDRYTANIVQRHVQARVAALYAKHPTVVARRRRRMDFAIWDESLDALANAKAEMLSASQMGGMPSMQAGALLQDAEQGLASRRNLDRIGSTLEIVFKHALTEQQPDVKRSIKQLVRRVLTCGVGYVRLGYQRQMAKREETQARIQDITERVQTIERLQADLQDGEFDENAAESEELRQALKALQAEPEVIVREGLTFDFPLATRVIVDPQCRQIIDFVGATWVAEEIPMSCNMIKEMYGVDVAESGDVENERPKAYIDHAEGEEARDADRLHDVYLLYDRKTGLKYTLCKGHSDFLEEPAAPEIQTERFFPYYPLAFNAIESEKEVFPPSDVRLLRHIQREYNRLKESLRQHRIANRPLYVTPAGALEDDDVDGKGQPALDNYPAHAVLVLNGLKDGQAVDTLLQPVKKIAVDPNLYETRGIFDDLTRVVGAPEASLGGTGSATATESSIAEGARVSSLSSNVDDLDDMLSALARDGGQVLLLNMSQETVKEIAGPGAIWPEVTASQAAKEIYLEIEAGSSGRPNKAQDLANFERAAPFLMQLPGIDPAWLARYVLKILDDKLDPTDALQKGVQSIVAQNQMAQPSTGNAATDPAQQGAQGAENKPQQPGRPGGPQPAFPVPS